MPSGRKKVAVKTEELWPKEEEMGVAVEEEEFYGGGGGGGRAAAANLLPTEFSSSVTADGLNSAAMAASDITKSGRMRKKTTKLIEMEEVDKLEKIPWKAETGRPKKQKNLKSPTEKQAPNQPSAAQVLMSHDSPVDSPLVIANVYSLASPMATESVQVTATGLKATKTKSKKSKSGVASADGSSILGGETDLGSEKKRFSAEGVIMSDQIGTSTPQFLDSGVKTTSTKKLSKKKGAIPTFTIKLENLSGENRPARETPRQVAGQPADFSTPVPSTAFPRDVLVKTQPGLTVKEEIDNADILSDTTISPKKEKQKKKEKLDRNKLELPVPVGEVHLLTGMSEMKVKKKKKIKPGAQFPKPKKDTEKPKKKRQKGYTAYMLWCSVQRTKVVAQNPGIDFAQISKRLGDMWQTVPEKEKMTWRRKARRMAKKGGTSFIKTGGKLTDDLSLVADMGQRKMLYHTKPLKFKTKVDDPVVRATSIDHLDVAAHLKLLGESLTTIGARLQEHRGQIAVQGSLSVLLDSLLCTVAPLMCLTNQIPQLNTSPEELHRNTLENIAYIMPGVG